MVLEPVQSGPTKRVVGSTDDTAPFSVKDAATDAVDVTVVIVIVVVVVVVPGSDSFFCLALVTFVKKFF